MHPDLINNSTDTTKTNITISKSARVSLEETAQHYERNADYEYRRAILMPEGCNLRKELLEASTFNKGRAKGIREALEMIKSIL